jgi:uncharacterized membrane protein YeaQ/YmgE (transglycosylase-associated protein family)
MAFLMRSMTPAASRAFSFSACSFSLSICFWICSSVLQERGTIEIRTANVVLDDGDRDRYLNAPPGNYVRLEVSDTGRGMGSEVKTHLFEPFFTTKAVAQGGGLGLSVVYGIVQQNAGDLAVDSEPGEGTRFQVYFPQIASPAGAVLGGFAGRALGFYGPGEAAGWLMALLGSIILLWIYRLATRRTTVRP